MKKYPKNDPVLLNKIADKMMQRRYGEDRLHNILSLLELPDEDVLYVLFKMKEQFKYPDGTFGIHSLEDTVMYGYELCELEVLLEKVIKR